jgi:hypothetical protein
VAHEEEEEEEEEEERKKEGLGFYRRGMNGKNTAWACRIWKKELDIYRLLL